ncbi:hypothetical protein BpHYR1_026988 [Brachionus plicatilis]|uniref:Uncharacterized protein n=1 Tax=Brachionus plicatilis TaxID=10195 RepID=A0A3M7SPI2_BRAPC|nr:hypothetical protein BpHYR1_026988 [Brachionus plicatilis]
MRHYVHFFEQKSVRKVQVEADFVLVGLKVIRPNGGADAAMRCCTLLHKYVDRVAARVRAHNGAVLGKVGEALGGVGVVGQLELLTLCRRDYARPRVQQLSSAGTQTLGYDLDALFVHKRSNCRLVLQHVSNKPQQRLRQSSHFLQVIERWLDQLERRTANNAFKKQKNGVARRLHFFHAHFNRIATVAYDHGQSAALTQSQRFNERVNTLVRY